jgi:hypothetical protein
MSLVIDDISKNCNKEVIVWVFVLEISIQKATWFVM